MHNQKASSQWFTSVLEKTAQTGVLQAHDKQGLLLLFLNGSAPIYNHLIFQKLQKL